ncbi:MAG: hypothetical protein IJC84_02005 [Clostridia bacterium]|nr:hypothetical protein [Clostridia bacterium]
MNKLYAGFATTDITPAMGTPIKGYYVERFVEGVLDRLSVHALCLQAGEKKVVLISCDLVGVPTNIGKETCALVAEAMHIPVEAVYLHGTHTHTGPSLHEDHPLVNEYVAFFKKRVVQAALLAEQDLKPARMGYGIGRAPNVSFVRRFRMKDGSVATNPGVNNPNILHPIGVIDDRVSVVRFDREGDSVVLVNFANHPDTVGGSLVSGDWPYFLRETVERALPDTRCIFFNGAQGDINHVNVFPTGGYLNDTFNDFDDVSRGYKHTRYIGRVVAAGVLQAFDKVQYVDVEDLAFGHRSFEAPSQMPTPEELPEAILINELHVTGRDAELPYQGMMLTTMVADAARKVRLKDGPASFPMTLSAVRVGPVAFLGIPGEPFNGIGRAIKETEGFDMVIPTCLTCGYQGYFPMQDAYDEGGYEARSSNYKAGIAELIVSEAQKLLATL